MGIPDYLTCLLRNQYVGQEATVRTLYETTDWFKIQKGVQQGCLLSPSLFNLYAEHILRNTRLDELQAGIKIGGRNGNNLRYAKDTTLIAESEEELKSLLTRVKEESERPSLRLPIKNTKIHGIRPHYCMANREKVEAGTDFLFFPLLGLQNHCGQWLQPWNQKTVASWQERDAHLDSVLKSRDITLLTKVCIIKAVVFPVVTYGCESWTIKKTGSQKINSFELWCWRRLLKVPWTARRDQTSQS